MKLTIICETLNQEVQENVKKLAKACGTRDYDIYDAKSHNIDQPFTCVLLMGKFDFNPLNYKYVWKTYLPLTNLSKEHKNCVKEVFQSISTFAWENRDIKDVRAEDLEMDQDNRKAFAEWYRTNQWVSQKTGPIEIKLKDNRKIGIYPDSSPLENKLALEMHASHFLNLYKIFKMFNGKEITLKD